MNRKTELKSAKPHITYRDRTFARRTRLIRNDYAVRTRRVREEAIERLKAMAEEAQKRATAKYQKSEERQRWAKIAAYLYQTLNSILNSYDQSYILGKLEEIEEYVREHEEKDSEDREEA